MIAEIFPDRYDVDGRRVFQPGKRAHRVGFRPTAPMGRYLAQPLQTQCKDFADMYRFLSTCRGGDVTANPRKDYWQPPDEFEKNRMGDCVDFSLWAWRQLLAMGYTARFVGGKQGKFGAGHAWVVFKKDGVWFLLEPQRWPLGLRMPRLSTLGYRPKLSVAWENNKLIYFEHEDRNTDPPLRAVPTLVGDWLWIWSRFWAYFAWGFPRAIALRIKRAIH